MATLDYVLIALNDWLDENGPFTPGKVHVKVTLPNQNDAARLIGREAARRLERRDDFEAGEASGNLPDGIVARRGAIEVEVGA